MGCGLVTRYGRQLVDLEFGEAAMSARHHGGRAEQVRAARQPHGSIALPSAVLEAFACQGEPEFNHSDSVLQPYLSTSRPLEIDVLQVC